VGLRVFGDYSLKVVDPAALIVNLAGTRNLAGNDAITDWMREQVLKVLRTGVTAQIVRNGWSVLGIAARTDDIEKETLSAVQAQVASYGVQIVRMGNFTISLDDKDEQTLKNYRRDVSYTRLAGSFTQYGAGEALRGIGEGAASGQGGAGNSALLGIGLGLGNIVTGAAAQPAAPAPPPPPAPAATPAAPAAAAPGTAHFCSSCGTALAPGAHFCANCGAPVAAG
jgi:membrane protease subunit (stomatin/prohibitin family)